MIDIPKIIDGCKHCIDQAGYSYPCHGCAYASEDECTKHLFEDVLSALKRLEFLEKPTPEEQPELPGIDIPISGERMREELYNEAIKKIKNGLAYL